MSARGKGKNAKKTAPLEREGTMAGTALEGEAFIKKQGGVPDKRKSTDGEDGHEEEAPKLEREGTMAGTAAEGEAFLKKQGGVSDKRKPTEDGSEDEKSEEHSDDEKASPKKSPKKAKKAAAKKAGPKKVSPAKLHKSGTMVGTAAEGERFLAKAGVRKVRKEDKVLAVEAAKIQAQIEQKAAAGGSKKRKLSEFERVALEGSNYVSHSAKRRKT